MNNGCRLTKKNCNSGVRWTKQLVQDLYLKCIWSKNFFTRYDNLAFSEYKKYNFQWLQPSLWFFFRGTKFVFGAPIVSPFSTRPKRSHYKDLTSLVTQKTRVLLCRWRPVSVNCANKTDTPGITMHYLPKDETLRQNWTLFVRIHRKYIDYKMLHFGISPLQWEC